jgi:hypothetical protein
VPVELGGVGVGGPQQEGGLAVRKEASRRVLGVQVLEAAACEIVPEEPARCAADPERVPAGEDVVVEPGLGDLGRPDRTAEPVVSLDDADAPAGSRQQRAGGE